MWSNIVNNSEVIEIVVMSLLTVLSAVVGASAYGVERGYYGKSRYIFKFKKNFEESLSKGGKKKYVYVEIVELTPDGLERRRPDLTRNVEVYSDEDLVEVGYTLMNGYYAETSIQLNKDYLGEDMDRANLIVSYRGSEGIFKNKIEFKV